MGTLNIQLTMEDTTNQVKKSKSFAVTTTGENLDLRVVPVTTSEYTFTICRSLPGTPPFICSRTRPHATSRYLCGKHNPSRNLKERQPMRQRQ
jgi:hypothetical protein